MKVISTLTALVALSIAAPVLASDRASLGRANVDNKIFHSAPSTLVLSETQRSVMERARASVATRAVTIVEAHPVALEHALSNDSSSGTTAAKITLALADNTVLTASRTGIEENSGAVIWRGTIDVSGGLVTLMRWANGQMAGTIDHQGHFYAIRHLGDQLFAIVEMDSNRMPPEHALMPERLMVSDPKGGSMVPHSDLAGLLPITRNMRPLPARRMEVQAALAAKPQSARPSGDIVIDVIVAYTPKAAANYADIERELIEFAIEQANQSFRMSNIGHVKLKLVHAYQTSYVEDGVHFDHLWRFADRGDGHMEEIHRLRDKHRADVAILIIDDPKGCGLATRVHADADEAFAVVHHECAAVTHSVAHEIGHIIGARHELNMDQTMTPFPYGHGYVNVTKWRDIMSYKESCGGCPRMPVWSSPKVFIKGEPAGTAELDNARVIAEQAARVAAFR
jgi:hypothetical protein